MFRSDTLFIIGAGASKEAGLPLGAELTEKIARLLALNIEYDHVKQGDQTIYDALRELVSHRNWGNNNFIASARAVAEAMELAQSIDTFLESHSDNREFVQLGKLGIVRAICLAERNSKLKPIDNGQSPFRLKDLMDTWYYSLARQLFNGVPADQPEMAFQNVAFIVFNYDRCLQVFLTRAVEVYFRLTQGQAAELVNKVPFLHPYGSLGSIFEGMPDRVTFASERFDILAVADRIKTFSESCDAADKMRAWALNADTLIFLGFGFHEQNLKLLDISDERELSRRAPKRIFATTKGMSKSDDRVVREQLSYAFLGEPLSMDGEDLISTLDGTCADLFSTYWRSLTA